MQSSTNLKKLIRLAMQADPINHNDLISAGNEAICHLLFAKKISEPLRDLLIKLCEKLYALTNEHRSPKSKYQEDFEYNTCDYRIARELVLRFNDNATYDDLDTWVKRYYYDSFLWHNAIQKMVEIKPVEGLVRAIYSTRPNIHEDTETARNRFWNLLIDEHPTWNQIHSIIFNTSVPIKLVKKMFRYAIKNNLLLGHKHEAYCMYWWKHIMKNAKTYKQHNKLYKKEEAKIKALLGT